MRIKIQKECKHPNGTIWSECRTKGCKYNIRYVAIFYPHKRRNQK